MNLTSFYTQLADLDLEAIHILEQAIKDIRKYKDRMSVDGRSIQHIADSLEVLIK